MVTNHIRTLGDSLGTSLNHIRTLGNPKRAPFFQQPSTLPLCNQATVHVVPHQHGRSQLHFPFDLAAKNQMCRHVKDPKGEGDL